MVLLIIAYIALLYGTGFLLTGLIFSKGFSLDRQKNKELFRKVIFYSSICGIISCRISGVILGSITRLPDELIFIPVYLITVMAVTYSVIRYSKKTWIQ